MNKMKIGVDIIENRRLKLNLPFLERFLTSNELATYKTFTNKIRQQEFVAGRWAAKEAIYKVLTTPLAFNLIEIQNDSSGAPFVANSELRMIQISISHEKKYSVAVAINLGEN